MSGRKEKRHRSSTPQQQKVSPHPSAKVSTASSTRVLSFHPPTSWPTLLETNRAMLMHVDPQFVFAYWEIDPQTVHRSVEKLGPSARLFLRFYDITRGLDITKCPSWDVEVFDHMGNWYLRLEHPEQKICFEFGLKNRANDFHRLMTSNIMRMPRSLLHHPTAFHEDPHHTPLLGGGLPSTNNLEPDTLRKILGPYFFDMLKQGRLGKIANTSMEAMFYDVAQMRSSTLKNRTS